MSQQLSRRHRRRGDGDHASARALVDPGGIALPARHPERDRAIAEAISLLIEAAAGERGPGVS
ncbi:MAG: hypothetical protein ACRDRT_12825 [Pseudonocardiaceae bacterium]